MSKKLFLFTIFLFLFSFSYCYAVNYQEISYNGSIYNLMLGLNDQYHFLYLDNGFYNAESETNYNNMLSLMESYNNFALFVRNNNGFYTWNMFGTDLNIDVPAQFSGSSMFVNSSTNKGKSFTTGLSSSKFTVNQYNNCSLSNANQSVYRFVRNNGHSYESTGGFSADSLQTINFNVVSNATQVTYSGEIVNVIQINRSVSSWKLGSFSEDWELVDFLDSSFGALQSWTNDGLIWDLSQFKSFYKNGVGTKNSALGISSDGSLYINNNRIYYNQLYLLDWYYTKDGVQKTRPNEIFYFVPYGSSTEITQTINPDANTNLDIGLINSLDDYLNYSFNSGDTHYLINSLNDPNYSGDIFGFTYIDYDDWGFGDFIINIFINLKNALSSYQNVSINFGILGDIDSSSFIIANSTVLNFFSFVANTLIVLLLVVFDFRFIKNLSLLDISQISSYDIDNLFGLF